MTRSAAHDLPDFCIQEGVDCHSCTASTARELARACPGLPGKLVTQLFVQIHTYPACKRMHANFTQAYSEEMETGAAPAIKKPMGSSRPFEAAAAVA
jgi:hypothetical protein